MNVLLMIYKEIVDSLQQPLHCSSKTANNQVRYQKCLHCIALDKCQLVRIDTSQQVEVLPSLLNVKLLSDSPPVSVLT